MTAHGLVLVFALAFAGIVGFVAGVIAGSAAR